MSVRIIVIAALALLTGCAQSPKEIRLEKPAAALKISGEWQDIAECITAQMDEHMHFGPLSMQAANALRQYDGRAEIISNYQGTVIAVIDVKPIASGMTGVSWSTSSYQMFLYTGALQNKVRQAVENCRAA